MNAPPLAATSAVPTCDPGPTLRDSVATALEDKRGEATEVYKADWQVMAAPLTSVHQVTIRRCAIPAQEQRRPALREHWVFYAVQNIGRSKAVLMSMPTTPCEYEGPDKYRLPVKSSLIPYAFDDPVGWRVV